MSDVPFSEVGVHLVQTLDEAMEFKRWLSERHENDAIAVDTETTGFNPREPGAAIRLAQFGDTRLGWAIPWEFWKGLALEVLNEWEGDLVMHNAAFDVSWIQHYSEWRAPWHRLHDTMLQAHLDNPTESVGLKPLAVRHIHPRADAGEYILKESMQKNKWTWATVPLDFYPYWAYGSMDVVLTARLHDHFRIRSRFPDAYDLEMAVRKVASSMEANGAPIDLEYTARKFRELSEYVETATAWARENWGISIGSNVTLAKFLTEQGALITKTTPKGAPSVDKEVLKGLVAEGGTIGQIASFVLGVRKAGKLASTYFENFLTGHEHGVLHPSINTCAARTSRMSIRHPALQTLPKGESTVRNAFIPREGEVLVTADYSQIEMRLMAHYAHDPMLQGAFIEADATGGDFFTKLGSDIYQDPNFQKSDKRRGLVKNTLYGFIYGAGVSKMAQTAGVPTSQMQDVVDAVNRTYPGIQHFVRETEESLTGALARGSETFVTLPSGRQLPVDRTKLYTGVNYLLQGTAAEVLKRKMVEMANAGLEEYMLLPVHDEIVLSVPESEATDVMKVIKETMSVDGMFDIAIPADPEGPLPRWGAKYE